MNEQLQQKLVSSLDKVGAYLEQGSDIIVEQCPLVVEEIIRYGLVCNIMWAAVFFMLSVIFAYFGRTIYNAFQDTDYPDKGLLMVATTLPSVALACFTLNFLSTVLYISLAPRLYVFSQIQEFIKGF